MKAFYTLAAIALFSIATISASAQSNNRNLRNDNKRIHQGVSNGELTRPEANRLHAQQANIRYEAYRYKKNDGHINAYERADLRRDKRNLSWNIYEQKHDRQRRY